MQSSESDQEVLPALEIGAGTSVMDYCDSECVCFFFADSTDVTGGCRLRGSNHQSRVIAGSAEARF